MMDRKRLRMQTFLFCTPDNSCMSLKTNFYKVLYLVAKATGITILNSPPNDLDVTITEQEARLEGIKNVDLERLSELQSTLDSLRKEYETDYKLLVRMRAELSRAKGKEGWSVMERYLNLIAQKDARTQAQKKELIKQIKEL